MASFDQKLRTLYLMEILLERTDDEHMLNASELCTILDQEYGISTDRRTIYTEMEILDKFGLDIQQKKGKCPGYYIGARDFELPELKLLVDAVQSSKFITEKKSKELIQKLEKLCCKTDAEMLSRLAAVWVISCVSRYVVAAANRLSMVCSVPSVPTYPCSS